MVCAPVRSKIPELKFGDYLSVQAHKPCLISHLNGIDTNGGYTSFPLFVILLFKGPLHDWPINSIQGS